jgi:hypothetical protein
MDTILKSFGFIFFGSAVDLPERADRRLRVGAHEHLTENHALQRAHERGSIILEECFVRYHYAAWIRYGEIAEFDAEGFEGGMLAAEETERIYPSRLQGCESLRPRAHRQELDRGRIHCRALEHRLHERHCA